MPLLLIAVPTSLATTLLVIFVFFVRLHHWLFGKHLIELCLSDIAWIVCRCSNRTALLLLLCACICIATECGDTCCNFGTTRDAVCTVPRL